MLGLQAKFSEALHFKSRQIRKVIFCNWGPTTFCHNLDIAQLVFSKITPPYWAVAII